jgi:UDP-3-O-[3-hydroxymyristoyl] glucosamine N-acyltransferase
MIQFIRSNFYPYKENLYVKDIEKRFKKFILKISINKNFLINDISSLENYRKNSLIFISKPISKPIKELEIILVTDNIEIYNKNEYLNKLLVRNLDQFYVLVLNELYYNEDNGSLDDEIELVNNSYISKHSSVHSTSKIGSNSYIGRGVEIGKNCIIKNNVVIKNSIISDNVIIGDSTVIGSTGFGFNLLMMGANNSLPHVGVVIISKNVRIGSSCTIDRAKIESTFVGENTMIDNLCHIAHNVHIGESVCIAAQCGISGSTKIGNNVIIGGQSGFAGHIKIGNNVLIAAKSGVTKNISDNSKIAGFPAIDIKKWKKQVINNKKNGYK